MISVFQHILDLFQEIDGRLEQDVEIFAPDFPAERFPHRLVSS